jgi:WD40 repeat protein/Tfp pilus assembly protein PilF
MKYQAFLSYSHAADNNLAADVQAGLHKFAKKWRHFRAVRTFRDTTNLSVTPALWPSITSALDQSEYFVLMASPEAARSPWVAKEVAYWLDSRPEDGAEKILIVLTAGQLLWNSNLTNPDFDWNQTDALPPCLADVFSQEPKYADLRWATNPEDRSLRNPQFRASIAELAAPLHGKDRDELDGEDVRQYKKATHFRQLVFTSLLFLLLVSVATAVFALRQSRLAQQNAKIAENNQARAEANALLAQQRQQEAEQQRQNAQFQTVVANEQKKKAEEQQKIASTNENLANKRQQEAVRNATEASHKKYLANVAYVMSVDDSTRVSEFDSIKARLDALDKPLRSWEWEYLRLRMDNSLLTIDGQEVFDDVVDVAVSKDGSRIVSATSDNTVRLWDANTGNNLLILPAGDGAKLDNKVRKVNFNADGTRVVAGAEDGKVRVWDAISGTKLLELKHERRNRRVPGVQSIAFSDDGTRIFSLTYEDYTVWNAKTGEVLSSLDVSGEKLLVEAFSPDGTRLVEINLDQKILKIKGLEENSPTVALQGNVERVRAIAYSSDGELLAVADQNHVIHVWNAKTGTLKVSLSNNRTNAEDIAFSRDGKRLVACSYEGLRVWDLETGHPITLLQGHRSTVNAVAFGADDIHIVSGAEDGTLRTWNISQAAHLLLPQPNVIGNIAISPNGAFIAAGERKFGQDKRAQVRVYEAATLKQVALFAPVVDDIVSLDFTTDSSQLAVAGTNGIARIFAWKTNVLLGSIKGNHPVNALKFSSDGKHLAIGTRDGYVTLWNADTFKPVWSVKGHSGIVDQLSFSVDNTRLASGSWDKSIKIWETETGKNLNALTGDNAVFTVSFSPDGERISSGSLNNTIQIWNTLGQKKPVTLAGHTSGVTNTLFSRDGKRIFSASADASLRLWDAEANEFITVLRDASSLRDWGVEAGDVNAGLRNANFGIQSMALSSDGTKLIAALTEIAQTKNGGAKSYLMIWNTSPPANPQANIAGNVVNIHVRDRRDVEVRVDQGTQPGVSILNFIGFIRYGASDNSGWEHELLYEKPLPLENNSAAAYIRRGIAYNERRDMTLAIADFTTAIELDPANVDAVGSRGVAYYFNGELGPAVEDLSTAIAKNSQNVERFLLLRGNIYKQWKRYGLALKDFDQVVPLMPKSAIPLRERGMVQLELGAYDKAIADFSSALDHEPGNPRLYDLRGEAFYRKGDFDSAEKDFQRAISYNKEFPKAHSNLASLLFDTGRHNESLKEWEIVRKISPKDSTALAGKVISLAALGKEEMARATFVDLIEEDNRFWQCSQTFEDEYFWSKSGCRALSPIVEFIRLKLIDMKVDRLTHPRSSGSKN